MAELDPATIAPQIAAAKRAGYSDDEIVSHLVQGYPQLKTATDAGYSSSEILAHIGGSAKSTSQPVPTVDDHGLARRQKMTQAELAVSPATEYPRNYQEMRAAAEQQVARGAGQIAEGWGAAQPGSLAGLGTFAKGAANVGLGALGYTASPISALYRSVAGQPLEDVTGVPREYTEFAAQLATPGIGFTGRAPIPGEVPRVPAGFRTGPEPAPPPVSDVVAAAQRLRDRGVTVPRAVTSESRFIQGTGQAGSKIPIVGEPIAQAVEQVAPQLGKARSEIAEEMGGGGTAENAAARIEQHLTQTAAAETQAAKDAAAQADTQATAQWQRSQQEREAAIAAQEQQSAQVAQQRVGPDVAPLDMGETVIGHVRANHAAAEANKNALYDQAGNLDARISDRANIPMARDIGMQLERAGLDVEGTDAAPASRTMLARLNRFSDAARARAETLAPVGQTMQEVEQLRKNLNFLRDAASNDADRHAANQIMRLFDEWHGNAVENNLMPGSDPRALEAMRQARAANADWRTRFGYNNRDEADKLVNKVVRGEEDQHTGPVGISNALTSPGDKSGPLFNRVMQATGDHPDVLQAIRSGTWNKLSGTPEGITPRAPERIASDIYQHLYGKGRDVAERVFTQEQRDLMRAHADTLRGAEVQRETAAAVTKAAKPVPTKVEPGPMQQLADAVVRGDNRDAALFNTIKGYADAKSGNVKLLAEVMRNIPQTMKQDFVHNFINRLGISAKTKEFSADVFAKGWGDISDQAKAVLLGTSGPHIQALNDIATVARRIEQVRSKFGNPSGTGFVRNFAQGVSAVIGGIASGHPMLALKTVAATVPFYGIAKLLASPQGASSVARFSRLVERMNLDPNIQNATAARLALTNVTNTAKSLTSQQPQLPTQTTQQKTAPTAKRPGGPPLTLEQIGQLGFRG